MATANLPIPVPVPMPAPPWRVLGLLTAAVLLAHALVLHTRPLHFGLGQEPPARSVAALTTRRIEPAAPVAVIQPQSAATPPAPSATTVPKPVAKPAKKPVLKQKVPVAQAPPVPPAIDSIASAAPLPVSAEEEPRPPDADSALPPAATPAPEAAAAVSVESAAVVAAPAPAASATATPSVPAPPPQTPVTAMALPASARLDYQMTGSAKGLNYHAQGELLWQHGGGSYNARMTVKALFIGSRTLSSTGAVGEQGLAPSRFSDKSRNEVAAHFEPDKGRISFSANTPPVPWTQGAQDRVSVFLQLGGMLAGNPAGFPPGSAISTFTVGPRDADYWTFLVEKEELLDLPFGQTATLKLARQPRREFDQKVELWFAPALGYLPVRSRITQANGDFVDQQLRGLSRP